MSGVAWSESTLTGTPWARSPGKAYACRSCAGISGKAATSCSVSNTLVIVEMAIRVSIMRWAVQPPSATCSAVAPWSIHTVGSFASPSESASACTSPLSMNALTTSSVRVLVRSWSGVAPAKSIRKSVLRPYCEEERNSSVLKPASAICWSSNPSVPATWSTLKPWPWS